MIKAIIWDMDGVVINSQDYHIKTEINTFKKFGINITPEISKEYDGLSITQYFQVISKKFKTPIQISKVLEYHAQILADFESEDIPLFEKVFEVLTTLSKRYKLGLATASPKIFKDAVLKKFNFDKFFVVSLADEEVKEGKPNPEIYLKVAKLLEVESDNCIVVEDSINGISAAQAAGMKVIAHKAQHNIETDFSNADFVVEDLGEIPEILKGLDIFV